MILTVQPYALAHMLEDVLVALRKTWYLHLACFKLANALSHVFEQRFQQSISLLQVDLLQRQEEVPEVVTELVAKLVFILLDQQNHHQAVLGLLSIKVSSFEDIESFDYVVGVFGHLLHLSVVLDGLKYSQDILLRSSRWLFDFSLDKVQAPLLQLADQLASETHNFGLEVSSHLDVLHFELDHLVHVLKQLHGCFELGQVVRVSDEVGDHRNALLQDHYVLQDLSRPTDVYLLLVQSLHFNKILQLQFLQLLSTFFDHDGFGLGIVHVHLELLKVVEGVVELADVVLDAAVQLHIYYFFVLLHQQRRI